MQDGAACRNCPYKGVSYSSLAYLWPREGGASHRPLGCRATHSGRAAEPLSAPIHGRGCYPIADSAVCPHTGQMTITCRHNDYNRNLGMDTNGFALQTTGHIPGTWERFQIWVPDSGGVTNGACNHPGAAHIYNAGHQRYIECDASGCKRGEFVTDTDKCNSAWHFHYAAIE